MRLWPLLLLLATLTILTVGAAPPQKTIVVTATGDTLIDRPAIQAAIDAAGKNYTVELVGTFALDGTRIFIRSGFLTIAGRAIDNDGDGKVNEDWIDALDNDFDGSIDEDYYDAVLQGVTVGGKPDNQGATSTLFNRGLTVDGVSDDLNQITVRDIKFTGLVRGLSFIPDVELQPGFFCDEVITTGGSVKNALIERNLFVNNHRGFQIFGPSTNVTVRDNVVLDTVRDDQNGGGQSILLVGGAVACLNNDGTRRPGGFPIGTPVGTDVRLNVVVGSGRYGIGSLGTVRTRIQANRIEQVAHFTGIWFDGEDKILVLDNMVSFTKFAGIYASGANPRSKVLNNSVSDVNTGFYTEGSGTTASNNTFSGIGFIDYWLDPTSSGNTVNLRPGQTVLDEGTDNKVNGQ